MGARRRDADIMKLMMSNYKVEMEGDGNDFLIRFQGPEGTLYQGGVWRVLVTLPSDYPFRSPSIGFKDRIFHPNIDEVSGSVCLDVINQTWSPMYDLLNIFDIFLPQLLSYPNASDPLNGEAASMLLKEPERYNEYVKDYVKKFANPDAEPPCSKPRHPSADSSSSDSTAFTSSSGSSSVSFETANKQNQYDDNDLSSLSDADSDLELDL